MNTQTVTINIVPGLSTPPVVNVKQGDIGRPIAFRVMDGTGLMTAIAGATAKIEGTKPSGLGFSVTGTISGNMVTLDTTEAMTQEAGRIPAEISFTKTGLVLGTANFILAVERDPHPENVTDGTYETMDDIQTQVNALDTRVTALEAGGGGSGLTDDVKTALLQIAQKVAYIDANGQNYYDDLYDALYSSTTRSVLLVLSHVSSSNTQSTVEAGDSYSTTLTASTNYTINSVTVTMGGVDVTSTTYSSGTVSIPSVTGNIVITASAVLAAQSITAVYTQSGTVYDTDTLDSLKPDLVVTANYSGGTSETVPASDYTLSGTLTVGTSTVTVNYAGLTTTFTVTVSEIGPPSDYTAHDYLAYIGGTGTRGIITPAQMKSEYTIEFDMYIPTQSGAYGSVSPVFGTRIGTGTKEIAIFVTGSSGKIGYWYNGTDTTTNITTTKDAVHHFKILPVGSGEDYPLNAVIDIDGTEYSTGSTASGVTWSAWFGIMGYGTSASAVTSSGNTYYQLGDIVVKDANGDTIYWFMPVSKGTQVGFYDIVGQDFYEADSAVYQAGDWT